MSQLENNGLGGAYNPDASAEWDRRAAEAGDLVGKFNDGLDLRRGRGVALGRHYVDETVRDGLEIAKRLPDADTWKYGPLF